MNSSPINSSLEAGIKVATWNILNNKFEQDRRGTQIAKEITDLDIVLLQEVVFEGENNEALEISKKSGLSLVTSNPGISSSKGYSYGTAILSNFPIVETFLIEAPINLNKIIKNKEHKHYSGAVLLSPSGRHIVVVSVHLPWGQVEGRRLLHAREIVAKLETIASKYPEDSVTLIGGDFNAKPESDTVRYLKGLSSFVFSQSEKDIEDKVDPTNRESTFWVDAWETVGEGAGYTVDPNMGNQNITNIAKAVGVLDPSQLPALRLDYIMIKDWVYGVPGSPLAINYLGKEPDSGGLHASDHLGLVATIWDPKE
jgi:endonuclease/exonuclease/phosphatase family metal-dependent hydrolase